MALSDWLIRWRPLLLLGVGWFFNIAVTFAHVVTTNLASKKFIEDAKLDADLATLPLGLLLTANALATLAAGFAFQYVGYKRVFLGAALLGVVGGIVCFGSTMLNGAVAMAVISIGTIPSGISMGVANYYRHAATLVGTRGETGAAKNIAIVFTSGAIGGIVGPALAIGLRDIIPDRKYAGVYIATAVISLMHFGVLLFVDTQDAKKPDLQAQAPVARPLLTIVRQRQYMFSLLNAAVSMSVMVLLMTITPLILQSEYLTPFWFASLAIQLHVVCMYLPSFLTSSLIGRFQARNLIPSGLLVSIIGAALYTITPTGNSETLLNALSWNETRTSNETGSSNQIRSRDEADWLPQALVAVGVGLVGLGWNVSFISATSMLPATYRPEEKFKAQAFNEATIFTLNAIVTLISGTLLARLGRLAIVIGAIAVYGCVLMVDVVYVAWERSKERRKVVAVEIPQRIVFVETPNLQP